MSEAQNKSGMSRAAQNKRKKLNKTSIHPKAPTSTLSFISDKNFSDDEDSEEEQPIKKRNSTEVIKKTEGYAEDVLSKKIGNMRKIDFESTNVADILKLKEVVDINSEERASLLLAKLIYPTSLFDFYANHWQKTPLFLERGNKTYFKTTFTKKHLLHIFSHQLLFEGSDIQFSDNRGTVKCNNTDTGDEDDDDSEQHEDETAVEVSEADINRSLAKGLTVTFNAPQKYNDHLWKLLSALEHEFGCAVGSSIQLAPSGSICNKRQHDASESFILQLEGSSRWQIYEPTKGGELPRSAGFYVADPQEEGASKSNNVDKIATLQVTLKTGDSLYIPRGWTYIQHNVSTDLQSLTLKVSPNRGGHCVADLLDLLVPQALAEAAQSSVLFRKSLPSDYRTFLGVSVSEDEDQARRREAFQSHMQTLLTRMVETAADVLDPAADQLAKQFMLERLPVPLTKEEEAVSSSGGAGIVINPYTKLRMVRPNVAILLVEDGKVVVYHCMDNSREQFASPLQPLEFELDDGPTIEMLLRAYPEGVMVSDLEHPGEELDDKMAIAEALFKEGFLLVDDEASKPAEEGADNDDDPF